MMNFIYKEFDYIAVIIVFLVCNIISFVFYWFFKGTIEYLKSG